MFKITEKTIHFDRYTAPLTWSSNEEYLRQFFKCTAQYLSEYLQVRGYLSFEKILDTLGVTTNAMEIDETKTMQYTGQQVTFKVARKDNNAYILEIIEEGGPENATE